MKRLLLISLFSLLSPGIFGQLTIEQCYDLARDNYPLIRQYDLIGRSEDYDLRNAAKAYLPQFSISGKATYQTDVTSIPITVPGIDIPSLSKDQYQVLAEVTQSIWDGGTTKTARDAIRAQAAVDRAQFEVDMYTLRERINELYFGILLIDEQLVLNSLFLEDLQINYDRVANYMANGVANQSDLDAVKVEQLTAGQTRTQLSANRSAYINMLSAFIGIPLGDNTVLIKPDILPDPVPTTAAARPEMELFDAAAGQLATQKESIRAGNMPRIGLFVQGGYGKPGLNMLQDKFKTFAIGGVQLTWNFGGFYTRRNSLNKIDVGTRQVDVQRQTFLFNNDLQQTQLLAEYRKYMLILEDDDQIIIMRQNITSASQAKADNGIISTTDLMRDKIAEQNAKINKAVHEMEMLQALYGFRNLINN